MAHKKIKNSTGKDIWGGIAFQINDIKDGISKLLRKPGNRFLGKNSASLRSLAGRYDNPIPTQILGPIDCSKNSSAYFRDCSPRKRWERKTRAKSSFLFFIFSSLSVTNYHLIFLLVREKPKPSLDLPYEKPWSLFQSYLLFTGFFITKQNSSITVPSVKTEVREPDLIGLARAGGVNGVA